LNRSSEIIRAGFEKNRLFKTLGLKTIYQSEKFEDQAATILRISIVAPLLLVMIGVYGLAYLVEVAVARRGV
jgi:uncharacterized membrane protein